MAKILTKGFRGKETVASAKVEEVSRRVGLGTVLVRAKQALRVLPRNVVSSGPLLWLRVPVGLRADRGRLSGPGAGLGCSWRRQRPKPR